MAAIEASRVRRAAVVGGGIAGLAAATVLAEQGVQVTLWERQPYLGGRAGSWPDQLADGTAFHMERGFHAFFRQYYHLRALLRRVDPSLSRLHPVADYPLLGPGGLHESFAGLPRRTPWNLLRLLQRSRSLRWRDLRHVDLAAARHMLAFEADETYARFDGMSAQQYLDSLGFPVPARRLLFDVFAHSFFNPPHAMSAGELLMMFHFYFTGNPEGLLFDVASQPFSEAFWQPLAAYVQRHGATLRLGESVRRLRRQGERWWVERSDGDAVEVDMVVLACDLTGLQKLVASSADLADKPWAAGIQRLRVTWPFVVWRLWLNRRAAPQRAPFVGTTGLGLLDNVSLYERLEDESRAWAQRHGGSVLELHAYAVPPGCSDAQVRDDLWRHAMLLYPELVGAKVLEERYQRAQDCPAFPPGAYAAQPTVQTPWPNVALAGDLVRLPFASALMERAAASGMLAADQLLAAAALPRPAPVPTVPPRGWLAPARSA